VNGVVGTELHPETVRVGIDDAQGGVAAHPGQYRSIPVTVSHLLQRQPTHSSSIQGGSKKLDHFKRSVSLICDEVGMRSLYLKKNVLLSIMRLAFFAIICINILYIILEKPYYPETPINLSITFSYGTKFPQNSQSTMIKNIRRSTGISHFYCVP